MNKIILKLRKIININVIKSIFWNKMLLFSFFRTGLKLINIGIEIER